MVCTPPPNCFSLGRAAEEEQQRQAAEATMRAKIEAELEERVARDIQAERDRVATESAALQEKMREFEEQRKAITMQAAVEMEAQKAAAERAVAEREAVLVARKQEAAQSLALGRALSQASRMKQGTAVVHADAALCPVLSFLRRNYYDKGGVNEVAIATARHRLPCFPVRWFFTGLTGNQRILLNDIEPTAALEETYSLHTAKTD